MLLTALSIFTLAIQEPTPTPAPAPPVPGQEQKLPENKPVAPTTTQQKPAATKTSAAQPLVPIAKAALIAKLDKVIPGLRPLAFASSPKDGLVAMTLEDRTVRIFKVSTRETYRILKGHPQPAYAVAWSPDGTLIATGDESARIWIWDAKTGTKLREMRTHIRGIQNLSFNMSKTLLASTGRDDVIKLYDPAIGKEIRSIPGRGANFFSATFAPKNSGFITGTVGGGARLYDGVTGASKATFSNIDVAEVNDVAMNPEGTLLAIGGRMGNTRLFDVAARKGLGSLKGDPDSWVMHVRFSPNGKYLAASATDRTVRIYDAKSYKEVAKLSEQSAVGAPLTWTSDGKYLLTTGVDESLNVWSMDPMQGPVPAPIVKPKKKK